MQSGKKYLITTDNWFYAPDGRSYRAVYGPVEILGDDILGIKTNRMSANWFVKVGYKDTHVILAGCQVHYATRTDKEPPRSEILDYNTDGGQVNEFNRPSHIYICEKD